ncbi:outer membrane protein assembly factor BamB family protein [Actinomadura litoris]|uniref:PQQ-binding-like beta-propeller repeat protein n=1 Tax=Actinomadura litoris TaxID=2678616 RepID=A0A7K1L1X0_9ACTN|nr:PQQ-binding-like beta-propeller repeat protein [Actinomadura litoris]MUN38377.1 PQQ-binding-like beta-propeller repeat protein [Actinomadura litoris]
MERLRPDDPGRVGRYRLLARLGTGGMGVVYLGRSPGGRTVAVKVIGARHAGEATYRARFGREIGAARTVSGAFTAPVLDADAEAAAPWLVTAYLPGVTLREAVAGQGTLPAAAVRTLAAGLAEALVDIHRAGLTHRDLKPANIMLTAGGPRVIDFGIARPEDAVTITRVGFNPGTPGFMSPEQAAGRRVGPSSDVYSLGAVLAFAATGAEPSRDGVDARLGDLEDAWLRDLIEDCLQPEPELRPSAGELLARLDGAGPAHGARWLPDGIAAAIDVRAHEARNPPERPPAEDGEPPVSRRALLVGGAAAVAFAGTGAALVALSRGERGGGGRAAPGPAAGAASPSVRPSPTRPPPLAVRRWKVGVGDYYPDLAAAGGVVLAHSEGLLRALDPKTGRTRWKQHSWDITHVSVDGDGVFLYDHFGGRIRMVRASSGTERWGHPWPSEAVPMYPVAGEDVSCFGYETVTALDARTGRRRWTTRVGAEMGIAVDGDLVVAADRKAVSALDAGTGRLRWRYPATWAHYPQACYGQVFVCDGPGTVHALRADTGAPVWKRQIGNDVYESSGFAAGAGLLYFGTAAGDVLALRAATGEPVWSRRLFATTSRNQWNALGVDGGTVYVGCADHHVYALDAADGHTRWRYPADVTIRTSAPVAVGGSVFVGTADGSVLALTPPDGV